MVKRIAAIAGKRVIKSVVRLEGTGTFAVFPSADINLAVKHAIKSICRNEGQDCYSPKLFLISN